MYHPSLSWLLGLLLLMSPVLAQAPPPSQDQLTREIANLRALFDARMTAYERSFQQAQDLEQERFQHLEQRILAARQVLLDAKLTERLAQLQSRLDRLEGTASGVGTSWGVTLGFVALLGGILTMLAGWRRTRDGPARPG